MGEFEVHRVRFFGLVPAGVRCMAYQHNGRRLALARTDGAVEVYNFAANYYMEKVSGGRERGGQGWVVAGESGENGEDRAGWWWGVWGEGRRGGTGLGDGGGAGGERGGPAWGLRGTEGRIGRGGRGEPGVSGGDGQGW